MGGTKGATLVVGASLAVLIALAGCAGRPDAEPVVSPVESLAPIAEATRSASPAPASDPEAGVDRIVVTSSAIELYAGNGMLLQSFDFFGPTEGVIAALTDVFGTAPTSERYEPYESGNGFSRDWGGFTLMDQDGPGEPPFYPNHWVRVTAAAVGSTRIETVKGVSVGYSAPALESAHPEYSDRIVAGDEPERLDVYLDRLELPPYDDPFYTEDPVFSVWVIAIDPNTIVTEFRAPSPNFGV